jgi:Amt family ammonium transporter
LKLKIDDVVGAIPVHGFAGIFGTLVVPLSNSAASFGAQLYGIIWVNIFVFIAAFVVWYLMKITMGIRISEEAEKLGTDKSEVGVMAYMIRD